MSVIGPRPQLVRDMVFMTPEQRRRHTAKPGLSGLAQVNGRNAISWEDKIEWDLKYIEKVSLVEDIKIIFKTVEKAFVKQEGITEEDMATAEDLCSPIVFLFENIRLYYGLFLLYYLSSTLYTLLSQYTKGIEKVKAYAIGGVINTIIVITSNILFLLVFKIGITGYILSFVLGNLITCLYLVAITDTLFLFCGKRTDRIKGLIWEGDGFLLLYKRIENGNFRWPRTKEEALEITTDQYQMLMQGLEIVARRPIEEVPDPEFSL